MKKKPVTKRTARIFGVNHYRLKNNPEERAFFNKWAEHSTSLLPLLLGADAVSTQDHVVAATVIQWLGSPVGNDFLESLGYSKRSS